MHLPRVDHDPVMFFQYQILSIDIIVHLTIDNLDKLQVIVPVAQCLPVRIPGQFSCLYVERYACFVVADDLRGVLHNINIYLSIIIQHCSHHKIRLL